MSKAYIQKPAPNFGATAVKDGEFIDVKLSDYKGNGETERNYKTSSSNLSF